MRIVRGSRSELGAWDESKRVRQDKETVLKGYWGERQMGLEGAGRKVRAHSSVASKRIACLRSSVIWISVIGVQRKDNSLRPNHALWQMVKVE
jgi:hypothetical protein